MVAGLGENVKETVRDGGEEPKNSIMAGAPASFEVSVETPQAFSIVFRYA